MHGEDIKEKRLAEYREQLEKQKEPFQKEKAEILQWIAETETSLGVPVSVTVPDTTTQSSDTPDSKA